ncbi:hypothetical protein ILYODFUR_034091 [Ilyodon furcidens]|uniref:Uncharacterized protein n=1 Tax=Ilyodon furcidens TaxID=33524 RepID=A0ABV0UAR1_9TELE
MESPRGALSSTPTGTPRRPGTPDYRSARRPNRQSETCPQPEGAGMRPSHPPGWGWPCVSRSGLAQPGTARSNPTTRRSPMSPDQRPGTRVGPRLRRTGRRHVPRFSSPHEGGTIITTVKEPQIIAVPDLAKLTSIIENPTLLKEESAKITKIIQEGRGFAAARKAPAGIRRRAKLVKHHHKPKE